ncbi:MAG: NAD(P)/FAD-dependent oxidoreductase [Candidatus Helarchaeota archaeon]
MNETDIVIAGAGPAGCAFALSIYEKFSIVILEKKAKTELGFDWIDGIDKKLIEKYEIFKYIEKLSEVGGQRFYSPDGTRSLNAPLSERVEVDRKIFAQNLLAGLLAKSNITFIENAKVKSAFVNEGSVVGVRYVQGTQEHSIKAKLTVDATGFAASLRKNLSAIFDLTKDLEKVDTFLTFRKYIRRPIGFTARDHKIYFGRNRGISWINATMDEFIDLFAGVPLLFNEKSPRELVQHLEEEIQERTQSQINCEPIRANTTGIIPTRRCLDSFCENGFLMVGDSACQVEPLTGSGVASGMLAGYLAAKCVNKLLSSGQPMTKANLWQYPYDWIQQIGAQYASTDVFRLFLLSRDEKDYNFLIRRQIITERDFTKSLAGEKIQLSFIELLRRLWRGWTRLGLLLTLRTAINDANRIKTHYHSYPKTYDIALFDRWRQKQELIFKKYYDKLW